MIEDLDFIVEGRPTWRDGWMLPVLGMLAMAAVLVSSFARLAPAGTTVFTAPAPRISVLSDLGPATGVKALKLPRSIATAGSRTPFSGITGLTSLGMSEGFRDLYRFADGRLLMVVEYPDRASGTLIEPASGPARPLTVRSVKGVSYPTNATSMPLIVGWVADGMQYQVGGAGFTVDELLRYAEALR